MRILWNLVRLVLIVDFELLPRPAIIIGLIQESLIGKR